MNNNIIGKRIKARLEELEMSQCELSRRSGCTQAGISRYISGQQIPSCVRAAKLAKVLGVSVEYLAGMDEDPGRRGVDTMKVLQVLQGAAREISALDAHSGANRGYSAEVDKIPTYGEKAAVRGVIRCKDCEYWQRVYRDQGRCDMMMMNPRENFYCGMAQGRRKV